MSTTNESTEQGSATTDSSAGAMESVRRLMDDRRRYEGWLGTLETRRESTPERVYDRVRGDYEQRLDGVIAELRGHGEMLRSALASLTARVHALRADEDAQREERAEGELRAAVGEHTPEEWSARAAAVDADIERLSTERGELTAELLRVQEMLAQTEAPRTPAAGSRAVATAPAAETAAPSPVGTDASGSSAAASPSEERLADEETPVPTAATSDASAPTGDDTAAESLADIDSLGFDRPSSDDGASEPADAAAKPDAAARVAVEPISQEALAARPSPAGSPAVNLMGGSMAFDELAFLKSVVGPRGSAADGGRPGAAVEERGATRRDAVSAPAVAGFGDAAKTLRCADCGTMNAPTEWYCERCGGELAAL